MQFLRILQHPDSRTASSVSGPRYLITAISFLNFIVSCVYFVTNQRLHIETWANLVQIFSSVATLIFLRVFRTHAPAANMFLATGVLTAGTLVLTFVTFPYTIMMWLPVYTIMSVYLAGALAGGIWSFIALTTTSLVVIYGGHFNPNPVAINAADLPAITVITLYLTGFSAFVASLFFSRSIRDLLKTQEKQNEELKEQNKTIQVYAQDKAMLVSIVVHDIATPLTIILYGTDMAQRNPGEAPNYIARAQRAAQIIEEIARSVREFQSIESGKKTVKLGVVDLRRTFERASFIFEDRLKEKNLTLHFAVPEAGLLRVVAEEKSLSNSVINNLVSNAIKFSHPGQKIVITAAVEIEHVVLQIRDFGVGMPEAKMKSVFSKSSTTSSRGTMGENGTGFGLPISKAYIDRYGGEIRVESVEEIINPSDHGTTITLRLRRAS